MIVYHQDNVSAFAGNHTYYFQFQPVMQSSISATSAGPSAVLISQASGVMRFVMSRIYGRVN